MYLLASLFGENNPYFNPQTTALFYDDYSGPCNALMNWKETPKSHIFEFEIPGLTKDDVKLQLHDSRVLQVSGEREEEELNDKQEKWHCKERVRGGFSRQFRLPADAKVDEIKACMSNGVLVVTVPKDDKIANMKNGKHRQHKQVQVQIVGGNDDDQRHATKGIGKFVCCKA